MDGANVYGDEVDCPTTTTPTTRGPGENRYPKRVFPWARAGTVRPIVVYPTREESGWVWVCLSA